MPEVHEIDNFAASLASLGLELPGEASAALAVWRAATDAAAQSQVTDLAQTFGAGELTPDNVADRIKEAALTRVLADHAQALSYELVHPVTRTAAAAIRDEAVEIIFALRPAWDEAAAGMGSAAAQFPPDTTATDVLSTDDTVTIEAWRALAGHRSTLDTIAGVRRTLRDTFRYGERVADVAMFIAHARDTEHLDQAAALHHDDTGPGGRWLRLTAAGYTLRLNTWAEARDLVLDADAATRRTLERQRARRAEQHAKAWQFPALGNPPAPAA